MALSRNRKRISVKGIGKLEIRKTEPTADTSFSDVGYLKQTTLDDVNELEDVIDEVGNLVGSFFKSRKVSLSSTLLQTSKSETDLLQQAVGQTHAIRYKGFDGNIFKWFVFNKVVINPSVSLGFQQGERTLSLKANGIYQDDLAYSVPVYFIEESQKEMNTDSVQLWTAPHLSYNTETTKLLDISGFIRDGTLSSGYASIWNQTTSPKEYLSFGGSSDYIDFGNVCNVLADEDFMIEAWVHIPTDNNGVEEILSKKNSTNSSDAGYGLIIDTTSSTNYFKAYIKGATGSQVVITSANIDNTGTPWMHVAVVFNRSGNGQIYVNGSTSGSAVSITSASGSLTNSISLYFGRLGSGYGQVDLGTVRIHNFGANGLPSDISTIVSNHYNGEKYIYGL